MSDPLDDLGDLLHRAKWGVVTPVEVERVARALAEEDIVPLRTHRLLTILGRTSGPRHETLVAGFLGATSFPRVVGLALRILTQWWDLRVEYVDVIVRLAAGEPWDEAMEARLDAISCAGEVARVTGARPLVAVLLRIAEDGDDGELMRQAAVAALARALGREYRDIPSPLQQGPPDDAWSQEVVAAARERFG